MARLIEVRVLMLHDDGIQYAYDITTSRETPDMNWATVKLGDTEVHQTTWRKTKIEAITEAVEWVEQRPEWRLK